MAYRRRSLTAGYAFITSRLDPAYCQIPLHIPDRSDPPPPSRSFQTLRSPFSSHGFFLPTNRSFSSRAQERTPEIGYIKDVAEVLTEPTAADAVATAAAAGPPFSPEVVAAAADSYFPVAGLQYFIDGVHSFAGVNWWAAIALSTLIIRCSTVPLLLNQMRSTVKLAAMKPEMEQIKEEMQSSMNPEHLQASRKKMNALFKKHGVTPFTPIKGIFIQGPIFISFFLAISNMAEKVPSFKEGGAFWFTDLTTPDPFYALPVLTGLTFLTTVELNMQEGMEGNPMAKTMKNFSRILAVVTVPFTASFPKAIFCYWVTSNAFSLVYGLVIKRPPVRKFLNLPEIPPPQPTTAQQQNLSFFDGLKSMYQTASQTTSQTPANVSDFPKLPERKVSSSSSAVISQRIRNLEKSVKSRKKPKRR